MPQHLEKRLENRLGGLEVSSLYLGKKQFRVLHQDVHTFVMLFLALVRQVVTVAAAEIRCAWGQVELADPSPTWPAVDNERADKPVAHCSKVPRSRDPLDFVVKIVFLLECDIAGRSLVLLQT